MCVCVCVCVCVYIYIYIYIYIFGFYLQEKTSHICYKLWFKCLTNRINLNNVEELKPHIIENLLHFLQRNWPIFFNESNLYSETSFQLAVTHCRPNLDVDGRIILRWIFRELEGSWGLHGVGSG